MEGSECCYELPNLARYELNSTGMGVLAVAAAAKTKRTAEQDVKENRAAYTGEEQIAPSMAEMNERR